MTNLLLPALLPGAGYGSNGATLQVDGHTVLLQNYPLGIDALGLSRLSDDSHVVEEAARLRESNRALLLGVDRLDYTKGIPQRLLAFEHLLEQQPELHGRISFIQIAVPMRQQVASCRDLRQVVEGLVGRINSEFGTAGWLPIEYLYGRVDLRTLLALYRAADAMIVTSQSDVLNLVAKEFVAARPDDDGVLVLSKFAGAAKELHAALLVNPNNIVDLSAKYYQALTMPRIERRSRMRRLRAALGPNTVFQWTEGFLDEPPVQAQKTLQA